MLKLSSPIYCSESLDLYLSESSLKLYVFGHFIVLHCGTANLYALLFPFHFFRRVEALPKVEKLYERGISDYLVGSCIFFLIRKHK